MTGTYWNLRDSWYHYRHQVKLPILHSIYRTLYYEIRHKEPWA